MPANQGINSTPLLWTVYPFDAICLSDAFPPSNAGHLRDMYKNFHCIMCQLNKYSHFYSVFFIFQHSCRRLNLSYSHNYFIYQILELFDMRSHQSHSVPHPIKIAIMIMAPTHSNNKIQWVQSYSNGSGSKKNRDLNHVHAENDACFRCFARKWIPRGYP